MAADRDEDAELGLMYDSDFADSADSSSFPQNVHNLLSTMQIILQLRNNACQCLSVSSIDSTSLLDTPDCQCDILRTFELQYAAD